MNEKIFELYPFLKLLTKEEQDRILNSLTVFTSKGARFLFTQSECQGFSLLISGKIRVQYTSQNGRETSIYQIHPGGFCHSTALRLMFDSDIRFEVFAQSDLKMYIIPQAVFSEVLAQNAVFLKILYRDLSEKTMMIYQTFSKISVEKVEDRLVNYFEKRIREENTQDFYLTNEQVAIEIGSTRETVNRTLNRLESEGKVSLAKKHIHWILNKEGDN